MESNKNSPLDEKGILMHLLYKNDFLLPIRIGKEMRFLTKDVYLESFHALYKDYPQSETLDEIEFHRLYRAARVGSV